MITNEQLSLIVRLNSNRPSTNARLWGIEMLVSDHPHYSSRTECSSATQVTGEAPKLGQLMSALFQERGFGQTEPNTDSGFGRVLDCTAPSKALKSCASKHWQPWILGEAGVCKRAFAQQINGGVFLALDLPRIPAPQAQTHMRSLGYFIVHAVMMLELYSGRGY